ncbi:hypothetical protein JCM9279_001674 [Rhodotorula babjevae]
MAKKNAARAQEPQQTVALTPEQLAALPSSSSADAPPALDRTPAPKVNTANITELKNALDDHVKDLLSLAPPAAGTTTTTARAPFTRSHRHDDVRLALGWASVAVAAATGYYGYRTPFHDSTFWVSAGVALYVVLNTALALYVALVEKNTIFEGKRRTLASRISTERLSVSSLAAASPRTFTASSWVPFPLSLLAPMPSLSLATTSPSPSPSSSSSSSAATKPTAPAPAPAAYPLYALTLSYAHSSSAGKALLHRAEVQLVSPCAAFFDGEGRLARGRVQEWVEGGLREVQGEKGESQGGKGR